MFLLSFFEIPIGVRKRLDFYRSRFFWQCDQNKKKYRLSKWNMICRPKDQGGLGIEVLDIKNSCLLSKWLFKIINEEGMWQELICNKYLKNKNLAEVQAKPTDSPFWKGLMNQKDTFFKYGSFRVGDGEGTRFWEDTWLGDAPLANQFPNLYAIVNHKNVTVASSFTENGLNISFRRNLHGDKWLSWLDLVERLMDIQLTDEKDTFIWKLTDSGQFSVRSLYAELLNGNTRFLRKYLWKIKVPLKIRIFMWFLNRKEILTKDNLTKRNWNGCKKCTFCDEEETIEHLFLKCKFASLIWRVVHFTFNMPPPSNIKNMFGNWLNGVSKSAKARIRIGVCALVWAIWNCRNDIIFNNANISPFMQVINRTSHWITSWAFLLPEDQRGYMDSGCTRLMAVVRAIFSQGGWRHANRIEDA
jgi:hypothetical protein